MDMILKKPVFNIVTAEFPVEVIQILSTGGAIALLCVSVLFFANNLNIARDHLVIEHGRANSLLLNILPESIANQLKGDRKTIADGFAEVTILFADIVDFTKLASHKSPEELVHILNICFSEFDELSELYGLEKIKTIGDAYMVAAGIPIPCEDHAQRIANFALDVLKKMKELSRILNVQIEIRIGINSGPVTAGVIGTKKFIYDLWGDAVNLAARMEMHGLTGKIQVTEATYQILKNDYKFIERGKIEVKGKGLLDAYFLEESSWKAWV
jgi:class 3 adenylate cyclase